MKKIVVLLGLFALGFAVTLVIMRWRVGAPSETGSSAERGALADEVVDAGAVLGILRCEMTGSASDGRVATVRLDGSALRSLLLTAMARSPAGRGVLDGARRLDVGIGEDRIGIDLELDSSVLTEELSGAAGDAAQLLVKVAGLVRAGDVDLEVSGLPEARNGELGLVGETMEVRLNGVRLPAERLAKRLRTPAASLEQSISFPIEGIYLEAAYLEQGRLVLVGRLEEGP